MGGATLARKRAVRSTQHKPKANPGLPPRSLVTSPAVIALFAAVAAYQPALKLATRAYRNKLGNAFDAIDLDAMKRNVLSKLSLPPDTRTSAAVRLSKAGDTAFYSVAVHCSAESAVEARKLLCSGFLDVQLPMPPTALGPHAGPGQPPLSATFAEFSGTDCSSSAFMLSVSSTTLDLECPGAAEAVFLLVEQQLNQAGQSGKIEWAVVAGANGRSLRTTGDPLEFTHGAAFKPMVTLPTASTARVALLVSAGSASAHTWAAEMHKATLGGTAITITGAPGTGALSVVRFLPMVMPGAPSPAANTLRETHTDALGRSYAKRLASQLPSAPLPAAPSAAPLAAAPGAAPLAAAPGAAPLAADPGALPLAADPGALPLAADPGALPLAAAPGALPLAADPGALPLAADPGALPLAADPGALPLAADPGALPLAADPDALPLAADPGALPLAADPGALPLAADPGVAALPAEPGALSTSPGPAAPPPGSADPTTSCPDSATPPACPIVAKVRAREPIGDDAVGLPDPVSEAESESSDSSMPAGSADEGMGLDEEEFQPSKATLNAQSRRAKAARTDSEPSPAR